MWPQEALYMPDFGEILQSSRTSAYGPGVQVEASRLLAEKFQGRYDKFYANTNLTGILGCDPLEDKVSDQKTKATFQLFDCRKDVGTFQPLFLSKSASMPAVASVSSTPYLLQHTFPLARV